MMIIAILIPFFQKKRSCEPGELGKVASSTLTQENCGQERKKNNKINTISFINSAHLLFAF